MPDAPGRETDECACTKSFLEKFGANQDAYDIHTWKMMEATWCHAFTAGASAQREQLWEQGIREALRWQQEKHQYICNQGEHFDNCDPKWQEQTRCTCGYVEKVLPRMIAALRATPPTR